MNTNKTRILILNILTFNTKEGHTLNRVTYGIELENEKNLKGLAIFQTYVKDVTPYQRHLLKFVLADVTYESTRDGKFKQRFSNIQSDIEDVQEDTTPWQA